MKGRGEEKGQGRTGGCHEVLVGFAGKDGQEVENIEEEVLIGSWHARDQVPVSGDDVVMIERLPC